MARLLCTLGTRKFLVHPRPGPYRQPVDTRVDDHNTKSERGAAFILSDGTRRISQGFAASIQRKTVSLQLGWHAIAPSAVVRERGNLICQRQEDICL